MKKEQQILAEVSTILNEITIFILEKLRTEGMNAILDFSTRNLYRDSFERIGIQPALLQNWRNRIDTKVMAVEIITTLDDSTEIHYHDNAYAVISILGPWEGVLEPEGAIYYFGSNQKSYPAISGITLQVVPGLIHGFRSPDGANPLIFLSVQSKKIDEDFHPV